MTAKSRLLVIFLFFGINLYAQQTVPVIEVPEEMEFAGMTLKLTNGARALLQKDILLITKNAKYFQTKVELANLYFPLIEKVFEEESFPKDFKYLALQESSLIADAVSKSNAVGYWQFKKESAIEVGLRVDSEVDERMNIVASSRGAARYLKRNNATFNNWIYSLLSYNLGLGGARMVIDPSQIGAQKMVIDENIHWYVIRFLAHKLVYQHAIGNSSSMDIVLVEYINGANKSIADIAAEFNLDAEKTIAFNKWLKITTVPEDKIYPVVLMMPMGQAKVFVKPDKIPENEGKEVKAKNKFPSVADINLKNVGNIVYTFVINGTPAILARNGDNSVKLAAKGNISKEDFLRYNEMRSFDDVIAGRIYYLKNKRNKAMVMFHTVQYRETVWDIAQNYGIKAQEIREKNRMDDNEALDPGRVLWLRTKRPKNRPVEYKTVQKPEKMFAKTNAQGVVIDSAALKKTEPLKSVDNNPINTTVKTFAIDSINYICTFHDVATGETLFGISRKYQIMTDSLIRWNNLEGYNIKIGQRLLVGYQPKIIEPLFHTVIAGETFYKIAKQYNISVIDLQQWNNKTDMSIKPGEKLIVKKDQP